MKTYKIINTGQLLFTKDMKVFYSCYIGDDPFSQGWIVKIDFEKMHKNGKIIEIK